MVFGGAILGLVVAFIARLGVNAGAARERRRVRSVLTDRTREVGDQFIIAPLNAEIARMQKVRALVGKLRPTK
jgi:hypothetical protein